MANNSNASNSPGYVPGAKDADGSEDPAPAPVHQATEAASEKDNKLHHDQQEAENKGKSR